QRLRLIAEHRDTVLGDPSQFSLSYSVTHSSIPASPLVLRPWCCDSLGRLRRRLIEPHAQAQSHAGQDFLDLVERLPTEVLRLQHFALGLLHELTDGPDIRVLQAVVGANRELE